ncbi:MAG: putative phage-related tail protein [Gammaproteobacteria bacterium]|nr:putative phage-related tail protein [Gammaproteobacteria bacterium]
MWEAYSIGISLRLNNLVSPQLKLLSEEFTKLEGLSTSLNSALKSIGTEAAGLRAVAVAGNASNRALEKASLSAASLEKRLIAIRAASGGIGGGIPLIPGPGGAGRGGGALPGGGGAGGGRGGGAGGFHGGNIHMGPGGIGLGTAGMAAGDWFWPLAATGAAIYGGKALYESAKDLDTERQRFKLFGLSQAQNREAFRYVAGMNVYGTTQTERMRAFRESQGVFRESGLNDSRALEGAKLASPVLAKLDFLASSLDDESAAKLHTANLAMLRYVESSGGLTDAKTFNRLANFGYKLNVSSGGTVNWEQLRQFRQRSGAAGYSITDEGLARLEPIIGENKGGATGFGISTAFNRLTGAIRIPNQVVHELVKEGIWNGSKILFNSNGGIKQFLGNPLGADRTKLLSEDPVLFYERVIKPMYTRMKFDSGEIARQNVMIFGTTGSRNMNAVEKMSVAIERSISALQKTKGIDASVDQAKKSPAGEEKEFVAAWTDFKTDFGTKMLPFFTGILTAGSAILRAIPNASRDSTPLGFGTHLIQRTVGLLAGLHGNTTSYVPQGGLGRPAAATPVIINIDGKKVASAVVPHIAKAATAPQTGTSGYDGRAAMVPAGGF